MSQVKKALFLDIDGTLLDDGGRVPDENREAIGRARSAGHLIILTSGRPLESTLQQAASLGLSGPGCYLIAYNGGVLYDCAAGRIIASRTIPLPVVRGVFAEANRRSCHIQTYEHGRVLVERRNDGETVRRYCARAGMEHVVVDDIASLREEPNKLLSANYEDAAPLAALRDWINAAYRGTLNSFFSAATLLEIVPDGLDKGTAVLQLANHLHIPVADTIAAGDEANDIPMVRAAGVGVAMANGIPEIRAAADYVTEADNNHSGIAEVIRTFLLS